MALNANESAQLATLTDDVSRMAGTVDDLLDLLRTAGQGGAVDIATHDNNAAAHGGVTGKVAAMRRQLTANLDVYLSSTGNDANDGLTPGTAKGSLNGLMALLNSIDPRGYKVTVRWSGKLGTTATSANLYLEGYNQNNLGFVGTSTETDGYLGHLQIASGAFLPDKLAFGRLTIGEDAAMPPAVGITIRLTGLTSPNNGLLNAGMMTFSNSTIEYEGSFSNVLNALQNVMFFSVTFTQIGTPVFSYFVQANRGADAAYEGTNTFNGSALPTSGYTALIGTGGQASGLTAAFPGGGKIQSVPGEAYAAFKGIARALAPVSSTGALSSAAINIPSVTKTGTGIYTVEHSVTSPIAAEISALGTALMTAIASSANTPVTVRTYNASGALADCGFTLSIY
jgi:hypothetical protein